MVAVVFLISLIEVLFVLPAHPGHQKPLKEKIATPISGWQEQICRRNDRKQLVAGVLSEINRNSGWIKIFLTPPEIRPLSTADCIQK